MCSYFFGMLNGFSFSFPLFFYFVVTPFFAFIISSKFNWDDIVYLNNIIFWCAFFVVFFNLYYIGYRLGFYHMPFFLESLQTFGGVKLGSEQLEVRMTSQASLIFLLPYLFTVVFFDKSFFVNKFYKAIVFLTLFFSLLVVIFSGRRSLQVIIFLGLTFNFILYLFRGGISFSKLANTVKLLLFLILFFLMSFKIIFFVSDINNPINAFFNTIMLAFNSSEGGGVVRSIQSSALIEYLAQSPIFGHGLNSHPAYLRNTAEPWSYEWVYLALSSQVGLLIFLFFICTMVIIFTKNLSVFLYSKKVNAVFFGGISNGFLCFIIAGSSNPMVYFIWFWILSLICFNPCFTKNKL